MVRITIKPFMDLVKALCILSVLASLAGCDSSPDGVVDSDASAPAISAVSVSPSTINTDTVFVNGTKTPDDPLALSVGLSAGVSAPGMIVRSLRYSVVRLLDGATVESGDIPLTGMEQIKIKGLAPKVFATINRTVVLHVVRSDVGAYAVEISAVGSSGLESNGFLNTISIVRLNKPPVISDLQALATVSLPQVGAIAIPISIKVTDENGLSDIQTVQFTSYLPSGQQSSSGPIQMFDDGSLVDLGGYSSGDAIAGDGTYTRTIQLPAGALKGPYTFKYVAIDKSRDSSNVISQTLTVQ